MIKTGTFREVSLKALKSFIVNYSLLSSLLLTCALSACTTGSGSPNPPDPRPLISFGNAITFLNIDIPVGIATDYQDNVLVQYDATSEKRISRLSPQGAELWTLAYGDFFSTGLDARMVGIPSKHVLVLLTTGELYVLDADTGSSQLIINLRSDFPDTRAVFDLASETVRDFSGFIIPGSTFFQDIAVGGNGNQLNIFFTGLSVITPFVARLSFVSGTLVQSQVLVSTLLTTAGNAFSAPGVAVNAQGIVLTTMPVNQGTVPIKEIYNAAVAFSSTYTPGQATGRPRFLFDNPATAGLDPANMVSTGLTTDLAGTFFVATSVIGSSLCGTGGSSAIIAISPLADQFLGCLVLPSLLANSSDVAVDNAGTRLYLTLSQRVVYFPIVRQ